MRLEALEDLLNEVKVTDMQLTKLLTSPDTILLSYEYQIHTPYLPPEVISNHITVNMLDNDDYADAMDKIIQLQTYNIDFDPDGL